MDREASVRPLVSTLMAVQTGERTETDKHKNVRTLPSALFPCFDKATQSMSKQ